MKYTIRENDDGTYTLLRHGEPAGRPGNAELEFWQEIQQLRADLALFRGAMHAQDGRERAAGEKCGVPYANHGSDWPDAVADVVLALRQRLREQTRQTQWAAEFWHERVVEVLKREKAIPPGLDVNGHPVEQVVATCLSWVRGKLERTRSFYTTRMDRMRKQIEEKAPHLLDEWCSIAANGKGHYSE